MWNWYGVKTLYRTQAVGNPIKIDYRFDASVDLIEERVVLFRARSHDEAIRKAEAEASKYASNGSGRNIYGQVVRRRYLGVCDSFQMYDQPQATIEVFSSTFMVHRGQTDARVISGQFGMAETQRDVGRRLKFITARKR
jgi:hypothetical protein